MTQQVTISAPHKISFSVSEPITLVPVENIEALGDGDYWKGFAVGFLIVICGGL